MNRLKQILLMVFVLITCVGCDQITKEIARTQLAGAPVYSFLGDSLRLQYTENPGAFLSMGASLSSPLRFWIFTALVALTLMGMLIYLLRKPGLKPSVVVAVALILAGGIGNLIDRILFHGAVTDFLNIGIGGLRSGIFNVADIAISLGTGLLVFLARGKNSSSMRA